MTFQELVEMMLQTIGTEELARREKALKDLEEQQQKYKDLEEQQHENTPRYTLDGLKYYTPKGGN